MQWLQLVAAFGCVSGILAVPLRVFALGGSMRHLYSFWLLVLSSSFLHLTAINPREMLCLYVNVEKLSIYVLVRFFFHLVSLTTILWPFPEIDMKTVLRCAEGRKEPA